MSILRTTAAVIVLAFPAAAETVSVGGHDVAYEVRGTITPDMPPILVLHGGMMTGPATWAGIEPGMEGERAVILVDQQGHGLTPDREGAITLESMRADTLGVLDALGIETAHVVGFSMGGMLGLELAVNAPDRVASLTAISASQNAEGMLADIVRMNREPGYMPPAEIMALLPSEDDFALMQEGFANNPSGPEVMQVTMGKLGTLIAGDWGWSDAELGAVSVPVQLLIGDNDFIRPEHAVEMAETIPGAWLGVLPDTTHLSILSHPALPGLIERRIAAE